MECQPTGTLPSQNLHLHRRVVWSFFQVRTSTWSRNLNKQRKNCVLYFLFEIVAWIQATNKASYPYFEQTWRKQNIVFVVDPIILEHALSSVFHFIVQLSFISKERGVFLCAVQTGRAHSQRWFLFPCGCAILLTMKGDRQSSCFVVVSSTFSSN